MSKDTALFSDEFRQHVYLHDKWVRGKRTIVSDGKVALGRIYSRLSQTKGYVLNGGISRGYLDEILKYDCKIRSFPGQLRRHPNISIGDNSKLQYFEKIIEEFFRSGINNEMVMWVNANYRVICEALSAKLRADDCIALVVPSDVGIINKIFIEAAKSAAVPTLLFHHAAVPVRFSKPKFDTTDYLIVWGELTKEAYISKGWDASKIKVSGHPAHRNVPSTVRCSPKRTLVCTKPRSHEVCQDTWHSIKYIQEVRQALEKNGITHALLRPHPSENPKLYEPFLDDFYEISPASIGKALTDIDMVIGPQSTFIVDAYYAGVGYLVYEPIQEDKKLLFGQDLSPVLPVGSNQISVSQSYKSLCNAVQTPFQPRKTYIQSLAGSQQDDGFIRETLQKV